MSVVQATSSVTLNDIRARILRLPRALREAIPRGRDTLDIRVAAIDFYGALTISGNHSYLGGVTELFRRLELLRSGEAGAEGRTMRVSWSYEPESGIAALEPSLDDPWQPLPGATLTEDPSPSPTDPAVLVADALARFTPEREAARRKAVDDARDFVQAHLGTFSPDDTRELLRLFNVDHGNGRMKADRFAPGFTGSLANDDLVAARIHVRQAADDENELHPPKSGQPRIVDLPRKVVAVLRAHQHLRGEFVFCRENGSMLQRWECESKSKAVEHDSPLTKVSRKAGLRRVGWHMLRHTYASHLVMSGANLLEVKELLGHASLEMTMRYAHLSPSARRRAVELLDGAPEGHHGGTGDEP